MNKLRVLDLFSGIGGFSLGLECAGGFETVAFCEIEDYPRRVLAKHWPGVPIYEDVRTLTADTLARDGIAVDVICGGFPCQDVSFAGKRAGLEGDRSGLWVEYARLIGELRPRFVIVENVPGLLSLGMGAVLGDMAALGYDATWDCIPASAIGAPHRRDRIWLVAHSASNGRKQRQQATKAVGYRCIPSPENCADASDAAPLQRSSIERSEPHGNYERAEVMADTECFGQQAKGDEKVNGKATSVRQADRIGGNGEIRHATRQLPHGTVARAEQDRKREPSNASWWQSEPDVGGGSDGFPVWLFRCVGRGMSHAESIRSSEVLRDVWSNNVAQALWRASGGLERLQKAEVLFAFVREYEAGANEARLLVAGAEASEGFLRSLRFRGWSAGTSHRSGPGKQPTRQHSDAMQAMPRLLARDSKADWGTYSWEDAVPRVASKVPSRVDRLKCLGNAVVPQIPELIGKAIMQAEGMTA